MSVGWVAAGAGVVSSVIGANASKKAASAQAQAAADAAQLQREQYDQTREDNAPFRERGNQAGNQLQYLLGLGDDGTSTASGPSGNTSEIVSRIRAAFPDWEGQGREVSDAELLADFERQAPGIAGGGVDASGGSLGGGQSGTIRSILDDLRASRSTAQQIQRNNPSDFGSLLRKFTMADRDADPVYQSGLEFGLSEGRRAVDNRFAAAGSSLSGAALKALTRFGNDYASTKAGESRNRYVQDQDATYNRLAGVAGTGQTATRDVSNAGANYANAAGSAIMGGGEARAAGYLGQANSINNGISTGYGMYQGNQLMDLIRQGGSRKAGWGSGGGWTGGGRTVPDYPGAEY